MEAMWNKNAARTRAHKPSEPTMAIRIWNRSLGREGPFILAGREHPIFLEARCYFRSCFSSPSVFNNFDVPSTKKPSCSAAGDGEIILALSRRQFHPSLLSGAGFLATRMIIMNIRIINHAVPKSTAPARPTPPRNRLGPGCARARARWSVSVCLFAFSGYTKLGWSVLRRPCFDFEDHFQTIRIRILLRTFGGAFFLLVVVVAH